MKWFSRSSGSRLYHLLYLLDDRVLEQDWIEESRLDGKRIAAMKQALPANGRRDFEVQTSLGPLAAQATVSERRALLTLLLGGKPLLSSIILGDASDASAELTALFLSSLRGTQPVVQFVPDPSRAYSLIASARERPLVASVHWPIIKAEQFTSLGRLDCECAFALLAPPVR